MISIDRQKGISAIRSMMINAKKNEEKANQILDFTREIKNMNEKEKIQIIKSLWKIIYSKSI